MRSRRADQPHDSVIQAAAGRVAEIIWNNQDETIPASKRVPFTFVVVSRGWDDPAADKLIRDALQRLKRGETAASVRERLNEVADQGTLVKLAGSVDELAAHLMEFFRAGDNSVEGGGSVVWAGKRLGVCYTYASSDHKLF